MIITYELLRTLSTGYLSYIN